MGGKITNKIGITKKIKEKSEYLFERHEMYVNNVILSHVNMRH